MNGRTGAALILAVLVAAACAEGAGGGAGISVASAPGGGAVTDGTTKTLVGKSTREIEALMGKPGLVRRDGPAEIWQYRNGACAANLFFYHANGGTRLDHVDARASSGAPMAADSCFAALSTR